MSLALFAVSVLAFASGAGDVADAWSYRDLDLVLRSHVDARGLVDYRALAEDPAPLDRYVEAVGEISPDSHPALFPTESERLAYWINAYNALVLRRVRDAWPVDSVRDLKPLYGVFWMERHRLGGERWTLRALENKIIRDRFGDPRIHFAINCASASCPKLARTAWRPETLDADLDAAARAFVSDPGHVRFEPDDDTVHLSRIFKWFPEDFVGWLDDRGIDHPHGVLDWIVRYLPEDRRADLSLDRLRIRWIDYDWSVNARP